MNKKIFFLAIILMLATACGCSKIFAPTYPKDKIPEAIQQLCKQEYGITEKIDVKIIGKTLGVRIHLDELLDINLKLQEKALDKLQNLLRIIRRVCLSTDAELDFFVIIGFEKKLGIEVVFYSYVDDLKRVVAGWMSPDDYFQRLVKTMRMDSLRWGNNRITKLFKDLESGNMIQVIMNNFITGMKLSNLSPQFLKVLTDLNKKSYIKFNVLKINSVPTGSQERLYYIEAREAYTSIPEEKEKLQYPSGVIHKFYILVSMEDLNPVVKSVYVTENLPEEYIKIGSPSTWDEEDFFVEDFVFHEFLSTQIIQRIQFELNNEGKDKKGKEKEEDKEKESPYMLKANFILRDKIDANVKLNDPSKNIFKMTISPKKGKDIQIPQETINLTVKTIKEVCEKYKFYDLGEIQLVDNNGKKLLTIDKPELFNKKNW